MLSFYFGDIIGYVQDEGEYIIRSAYDGFQDKPRLVYGEYKKYALADYGIVATQFDVERNQLRHTKHLITYPHEWPPSMFKDAVLFHLDLLLHLHRHGMTLKDGLPENILFDGIRPVFIDFFSLANEETLKNEFWLTQHCPKNVELRLYALRLTFVPHMLIPLLCYALGDFSSGKRMLAELFCNNRTGKIPSWEDLPLPRGLRRFFRAQRGQKFSFTIEQIRAIRDICSRPNLLWQHRLLRLRILVAGLDVNPPESAYATYYEDKKENWGLGDTSSWQEKQLGVQRVLQETRSATVLDLGANTGWFSQLACHMGASVIAADIDIACADALYRTAAFCRLPLTPLCLSFDALREEHFASGTGEHAQSPIHMAALKRLQSDCVLCLGFLHHLTLGLGKNFADVFEQLSALTRNTLILEFVSLEDRLVREDPDFFQKISVWTRETYNLDAVKQAGVAFFSQCSELSSTPSESRTLLVFRR
jgi:SAM-dependent methyltransferase